MTTALAAAQGTGRPPVLEFFPLLDALLKDAVTRARQLYNETESEESFRGLYISEQEVDSLIARTGSIASPGSAAEFLEHCASLPGVEGLSHYWQLSPFDHAAMLLALAPEIDLKYERIYAYLQDDVTRRKPTADLALTLFSSHPDARLANRARFSAGAPLLQSGLLRLLADPGQAEPSLLSHYLRLDESAVRMLLGDRDPDPCLAPFCDFSPEVTAPVLPQETLRRLPQFVAEARKQGGNLRLLFSGPERSSKRSAAQIMAASLGVPLLAADLSRHHGWHADPAALASQLMRAACRTGAVLHLEGLDAADPAVLQKFFAVITEYRGIITVASESPAVPPLLETGFLSIPFPMPDYETRCALWQATLADTGIAADAAVIPRLANQFVYAGEQIAAAVESTRRALDWRATANGKISSQDVADELMRAARAQSGAELASLATKIQPVYTWSDIVLPQDVVEQLEEICQRVVHRHDVLEKGGFGRKLSAGKGIAVLFAGPSCTGKTMAAEVIANELGLDLYRIDLSSVVSKYIGETEKNLERIFNAAARSNSVLLFDEADALCGKRSEVRDAHDRYANIEISYLLQKMEQYEGVTILTTNLRGNLDEAFARRLAFTVHFPFPSEEDRLRIWKQIWPAETCLDPGLDFAALARHFKLSGGNVKNIALSTAFLAAAGSRSITMSDLLHCTRREYEKVGKVISAAEIQAVVH